VSCSRVIIAIVLAAERDEATILAALSTLPPDTPGASTPEELARLREHIAPFLRDGWGAAHDAYAALSTRGRRELVDSTQNMVVDKPDVVISAVVEVLSQGQARAARCRSPATRRSMQGADRQCQRAPERNAVWFGLHDSRSGHGRTHSLIYGDRDHQMVNRLSNSVLFNSGYCNYTAQRRYR
jgi:hypothetical protein